MTAQALAGILAGLLLAALVAIALLERRRRALELDVWSSDNRRESVQAELAEARVRQGELGADLEHARAAVRASASDAEASRRRLEELELERRRSPLEGELVIVNTRRPDDQTIRGTVVRELSGDRLLLAGAEYLHAVDGEAKPRATPIAGDVVTSPYSFAQIVQRTSEA